MARFHLPTPIPAPAPKPVPSPAPAPAPAPGTINGTAGNDVLVGTAGNDVIYGGNGADTMTGGAGADTFVYTNMKEAFAFNDITHTFGGAVPTAPNAPDFITDFQAGVDKIDLSAAVHAVGGSYTFYIQNDAVHDVTRLLVDFGYENSGQTTNFEIDFKGQNALSFHDILFG